MTPQNITEKDFYKTCILNNDKWVLTPQEIASYKQRWMSEGKNYICPVHESWADEGKRWCKTNLAPQSWKLKTYTDIYEHTFYFESMFMCIEFSSWYENR